VGQFSVQIVGHFSVQFNNVVESEIEKKAVQVLGEQRAALFMTASQHYFDVAGRDPQRTIKAGCAGHIRFNQRPE
jgi:hypothetical protein